MKKFLLISLLFFIVKICIAQTGTGTLSGIVKDSSNSSLDGVTIKIKGTYYGTISNPDGTYKIEKITPGDYTVEFSYVGYKNVEYTDVRIKENGVKELNVTLSISAFTVDQEIVVIGERPLLDIEETSSRHIMSSDDISKLSVVNIKDIVTQQAGVVQSDNEVYIRGGRNYENSFLSNAKKLFVFFRDIFCDVRRNFWQVRQIPRGFLISECSRC